MDRYGFNEEELKKSRTITLGEFVEAQSKAVAGFLHAASVMPGANEAIFPVIMMVPAIMAKLANMLFNEAEPAMDEAQDADRVEKKE